MIESISSIDENFGDIQKWRQNYHPQLPDLFAKSGVIGFRQSPVHVDDKIKSLFPFLSAESLAYSELVMDESKTKDIPNSPLRIGVVLSGGQAAGGHNVISGVFDFIKNYHANSQLFGFKGGPIGIYSGIYTEIDDKFMSMYRNQGGFDMICSGRHKIETEQQMKDSLMYCESLKLDGLIVIGGDDSNTNACILAEFFKKNNCPVKVIGVPKTIDGDLKNEWIEVSFGFDTATRVYSELIGNLCLDTLSSKKYYHFIRLMGRSASHIALECALQTQPNLVLIGEEVEFHKQTLQQIVDYVADIICKRAEDGRNYGVILVPEGLIEFIPEMNVLIKEINEIVSKPMEGSITEHVIAHLTDASRNLFKLLPTVISHQLLLDRDPHGNVQVSKIDTERLLILLLTTELENRKKAGNFVGKFSPQSHFFGYEGRCALPSYFDTEYCYSLGYTAGALVSLGMTGYMSVLRGLDNPSPQKWVAAGCPLMTMMNVERRKGKPVPVIKKALVDLNGQMFNFYQAVREIWALNDAYITPGPIQFEGPCASSCPFLVTPPSLDNIDIKKYIIPNKEKGLPFAPKSENNLSRLSTFILKENILLPKPLAHGYKVTLSSTIEPETEETRQTCRKVFKNLMNHRPSKFLAEILDESNTTMFEGDDTPLTRKEVLKIGIVMCGRQAPGGNSIINGLLEFKNANKSSDISLIGFKKGTLGFFEEDYLEITPENFALYKNHGGYDYLGRSVDKIRSPAELKKAKEVCEDLQLDGIILVGASHTLTDGLYLTEYFLENNVKTGVITIPSTVDGNVTHPLFESSIGFDTASKVYSHLIGNIMTDSASATKYWYFIRLMGRDPSHLALECALQTHPNYVIISEEFAEAGQSFGDIVNDICDVISERANKNKNFGCVLIPEGLLSHLPHYKLLIQELNKIFEENANDPDLPFKLVKDPELIKQLLSPWSTAVFMDLPDFTRNQLLLERESAGTIQLSQIETERLLAYKIGKELDKRKEQKRFKGSYSAITHFFGYQGRCSFPSMFDNTLATCYGFTAACLIQYGLTGFCVTARGLSGNINQWKCAGIPLIAMTSIKGISQYGENRPIILSSNVALNGTAFLQLKALRKQWVLEDHYTNPGPMQFYDFGKYFINMTLKLNHENYNRLLEEIENYCEKIKSSCRFGAPEDILKAAVYGLESTTKILGIMNTKIQ